MKKVYFLKTCGTCKRIMSELDLDKWEKREIKIKGISKEELQEMHNLAGTYEALFSNKSTQIKARNLDVSSLHEDDFKTLILDHYSFLKRPVFIDEDRIFIGNDKKTVEFLKEEFVR